MATLIELDRIVKAWEGGDGDDFFGVLREPEGGSCRGEQTECECLTDVHVFSFVWNGGLFSPRRGLCLTSRSSESAFNLALS